MSRLESLLLRKRARWVWGGGVGKAGNAARWLSTPLLTPDFTTVTR